MSYSANTVFNVLAWFAPALTALIATPITVRGLGPHAYGLLALVTAVTGYLGLMDLGLGIPIVRYLAYYRALNQGRPMIGLMRFAVEWFGGAGVIGALILLLGARWIAVSVLGIPADMIETAVAVIRITGLGFLTGMLVSVGTTVPQGFLRYDIAAVITVVFGVAGSGGPALLVAMGFGVTVVVAYGVVLNAISVVVYVIITVRLFRPIDRQAGPDWPSVRRAVIRFSAVTALNRVGRVVSTQSARIVLGAADGVAAAAYYQVPNLLTSKAISMLAAAAQVVFPTASAMKASGDEAGVRALYTRTSRLFFVVNGSVAMSLCVLAHPLLQYWVSAQYAQEGAVALVVFAVTGALDATTMSAAYIVLSAARPGVNLWFSLANSAILLATVYPLTVAWGVTGAAVAGLLGEVLTVPFMFLFVHRRIIGVSSYRVWRECYSPTVLGAGLMGVTAYLLIAPRLSNLAETLLALAVLTLAEIAVSGLLGGIKREDVATAIALIRRYWPRRT